MRSIARILKSYGTDGAVMVSFRDGIPDDFDTKRPVFLYFEGLPVPFFITSFTPKGSVRAQVRFEDIDSLKDAEEISGMMIFTDDPPVSDRTEGDDEGLCVEDLEGYEVLSEDGTPQGRIERVDDYSGNIVLTLGDGRIVPYHDELFVDIDEESRTVTLIIPEGL